MWKKYLQRIILIVIATLAIKTSVGNFISSIKEPSNDTVVIAKWTERLSKLIAPVPFKRGVIGYISDEDIPDIAFDANDAEGEYILVQYAIVPIIIVRGTDQEWNILNLTPKAYERWTQTNADKFEVLGFKGGMYLVRRVNQ